MGIVFVLPALIISTYKQTSLINMRVIEKNMNAAIRNGRDFRSSNTTVTHGINDKGQREVIIKLHGNHIATVLNDTMLLFDGGWQSNTTKSRLNALCYEFATGYKVFQKNWDWFVADFHNNAVDFVDGFELAIS
jgi:hypothetical protein|tara:strand:- start:114 stop:515 length:402 start_codon:yes stop_codon:yes gene_type:complete